MISHPELTVGVPVYNGERYLRESLDALARQSYGEFRGIIGDNCSTDGTQEIARQFVREDSRFEYVRHEENIGGVRNSNYLLGCAQSRWFKWAYHDDLCDFDLFEKSMKVLAGAPESVLAYPRVRLIDESGAVVGQHEDERLNIMSDSPDERVAVVLRAVVTQVQFGIMLTEVAKASGGTNHSVAGEMILPVALALRGELVLVSDGFVSIRQHADRHGGGRRSEMAWVNPNKKRTLFPYSRSTFLLLQEVRRAALSATDRRNCVISVLRNWTGPQWRVLVGDLVRAPADLGLVRFGRSG